MSRARDNADLGHIAGRRNLLINGGFDIWQRGTGFSATGYTADHWYFSLSGGPTGTISRGENNSFRYLRYDLTTNPGTGQMNLMQNIEDVRIANSKTMTFSMNVVVTGAPLTLVFWFDYVYGSGGSASDSLQHLQTVDFAADGLHRVEFTVDTNNLDAKTIGANSFFRIAMTLANATIPEVPLNQTGILDIINCQLEIGDKATPFERRPIGEELALCQRYYQKLLQVGQYMLPLHVGSNLSSRDGRISYTTSMRVPPNVTVNSMTGGTITGTQVDESSVRWYGSATTDATLFYLSDVRLDAEL